MLARDSMLSHSSTTTYPSTISSPDMLGLSHRYALVDEGHHDSQEMQAARLQRASKTRLRQSASKQRLTDQRVTAISDAYMTPPPTPKKDRPIASVPALNTRQTATPPRTAPRGASNDQRDPHRAPQREEHPQQQRQAETPVKSSGSAIRRKPVPTAGVPKILGDEWESQLVQDAKRLRNAPAPEPSRQEPSKEVDWERSGMWDKQLDAAREAEDRVRREAGREIAYPPIRPSVPIRAGSSGVTSVHVGVRPRLHPSRATQSLEKNQPDTGLPEPLFSPLAPSQKANLPDEAYLKAQAEYEAWLSRKAEREGDMGDGAFGTRDWVPRERVVARPGGSFLEQAGSSSIPQAAPPHSAGSSVEVPTTPATDEQYMYQQYLDPAYLQQFYGPYWDPYMYGGYAGMMDPGRMAEEYAQRVQFAPSPDKSRTKAFEEGTAATGDLFDPHRTMFGLSPDVHPAMLPDPYGQPRSSQYGGVGFGLGGGAMPMSPMGNPAFGSAAMGWAGNSAPMPGMGGGMGAFAPGLPQRPEAMRGSAFPAMFGGAEANARGAGMNGMAPQAMPGFGMSSHPMASLNIGNMMYPQYGWNMPGLGMQQGMWPGGMAPPPAPPAATTPSAAPGGDAPQLYDPSKSKSSWLGHYGYLEGRELAGPPPGYLPAGMQPWQAKAPSPSPSAAKPKKMSAGTQAGAPSTAGNYPASSAPGPHSAWGEGSPGPRARYDGKSSVRYLQADVETPYPRSKSGGMISAWQHDQARERSPPIDGRLGKSHQRQREGKV